jgi:hypothetical protein
MPYKHHQGDIYRWHETKPACQPSTRQWKQAVWSNNRPQGWPQLGQIFEDCFWHVLIINSCLFITSWYLLPFILGPRPCLCVLMRPCCADQALCIALQKNACGCVDISNSWNKSLILCCLNVWRTSGLVVFFFPISWFIEF